MPQVAILRARGFAGFAGVGQAMDGGGDYWEQVAASVIRCYLHAAALEGLGVDTLLEWSRQPGAEGPVHILNSDKRQRLAGAMTCLPPPGGATASGLDLGHGASGVRLFR